MTSTFRKDAIKYSFIVALVTEHLDTLEDKIDRVNLLLSTHEGNEDVIDGAHKWLKDYDIPITIGGE